MKINALLVDDSKSILGVMRCFLTNLGVDRVEDCSSGFDALTRIERSPNQFNIVFVDLNMPGMDGMELIRLLGAKNFSGCVVIVSAMDERVVSMAAQIARQHKIHLIGCMSKPVNQKELANVLKKLRMFSHRIQSVTELMDIGAVKHAVRDNLLIPYFQPKVNIQSGQVHSLELLARIKNSRGTEAILPGRFIPVVEDYLFIEELTFRLIERALEQFKIVLKTFPENCLLAINLSPNLLENSNIPDQLYDVVSKYYFAPEQIIFEITEEYAVKSTVQLENMNRLRMKGFGLSLDDFGTGFTNIQQLKNLPYTEIKLDRSLIFNVAQDQLSQVILRSLHNIAQELKLCIVAEGIDNLADFEYLKEDSKPYVLQGYIISKPKPLDALIRWFHAWQISMSPK